jgi:peptidoglycan DL-endopeptidase CwlO
VFRLRVFRLRARVSAVSLLVIALVGTSVLPVAAQPIDVEDQLDRSGVDAARQEARELRGSREQLQARLDEIEREVSAAVETYNVAVEDLEAVQADLAATQEEIAELTAEFEALSAVAAGHVRRLHKLGGPGLELATMFASGNPTDAGARSATLRRVLDAQLIDLEALAATRTSIEAAEVRLAELEAQAADRADEVEAALEDLQATLAEHQDELRELEAALRAAEQRVDVEEQQLEQQRRELVAREQARRDEEARARREAEERARQQAAQEAAAREAASRSSSTTTSSSSTGTSTATRTAAPAPAPAPMPSTRSSASVAVSTALGQVGKPYQWGASGPNSFDCSGLTSFAWRAAGVTIPRSSGAQYAGLTKVSRGQLQPGDLVFYYSPISHVAMYIGGGQIVEAPFTGATVRVRSMDAVSPVGYARP